MESSAPFVVLEDVTGNAHYLDYFCVDSSIIQNRIERQENDSQVLPCIQYQPSAVGNPSNIPIVSRPAEAVAAQNFSEYVTEAEDGLIVCLLNSTTGNMCLNNISNNEVKEQYNPPPDSVLEVEVPNLLSKEQVFGNSTSIEDIGYLSNNLLSIEDRLAGRDSLLPPRKTRRATPIESLTCLGCQRSCSTSVALRKHCNSCKHFKSLPSNVLKTNSFSCSICKIKFSRALLLKDHMNYVHNGDRPLKCNFCEKRFYRSHDLKMHINIHLNIKSYICDECGRQFNHVSNLIRHQRSHTGVCPYVCDICKQRFSQTVSLRQHYKQHMEKSQKAKRTLKGKCQRRCYCQACGKIFNNKLQLIVHEKEEHSSVVIECCSCCNSFPTLEALKNHSCAQIRRRKRKKVVHQLNKSNQFASDEIRNKNPLGQKQLMTLSIVEKIPLVISSSSYPANLVNEGCKMLKSDEENSTRNFILTELKSEKISDESNILNSIDSKKNVTINEDGSNTLVMYLSQGGDPMTYVIKNKQSELVNISKPVSSSLLQNTNNETILINVDEPTTCNEVNKINLKALTVPLFSSDTNCLHFENIPQLTIPEGTPSITCHIDRNTEFDVHNEQMYIHSIVCDDKIENIFSNKSKDCFTNLNCKSLPTRNHNIPSQKKYSDSSKILRAPNAIIVKKNTHSNGKFASDKTTTFRCKSTNGVVKFDAPQFLPSSIKRDDPGLNSSDLIEVKEESIEVEEVKSNSQRDITHRIYKCPNCLKMFNRKWNYEQHCAVHYPGLHKYKCAVCDRTFAYRTSYSSHMTTHDEKVVKFPCQVCSKVSDEKVIKFPCQLSTKVRRRLST